MAKIQTQVGQNYPEVENQQNQGKEIELETTDILFIQYLQNAITIEGKFPYKFPEQSFPRVIVDAAKWFYMNYDDAVEECWYAIRNRDLKHEGSFNKSIQLPLQIEAIQQIYPTESALIGLATRFAREPMYYAAAVNCLNNFANSYQTAYRQFNRDFAYEESVVKMYEYAATKTLFRRGIRFDFNRNTHKLRILSQLNKDIVLNVFKRIELAALYEDPIFRKYCIACCMENMQYFISALDYKLPGEVAINVSMIEKRGIEAKEKIEEKIEKDNNGSDLFIVK